MKEKIVLHDGAGKKQAVLDIMDAHADAHVNVVNIEPEKEYATLCGALAESTTDE